MTIDDLFDMEDRARNTCPDATIELILAELSALMSQIARLDQNHQALEAENVRLRLALRDTEDNAYDPDYIYRIVEAALEGGDERGRSKKHS